MSTKSICRSNVLLVHMPFSVYLLPSTLLALPLFQILFPICCPFPSKHPCNCIHTAHFLSICINPQFYQVLLVLLLGSYYFERIYFALSARAWNRVPRIPNECCTQGKDALKRCCLEVSRSTKGMPFWPTWRNLPMRPHWFLPLS